MKLTMWTSSIPKIIQFLLGALPLTLFFLTLTPTVKADEVSRLREKAISLARQGDIKNSYQKLVELHHQYPNNLPVLYDLVELAARAGQLEQSFEYGKKIANPKTAPTYALEYMGKVARGVRQYQLSERYYRILYQRQAKADYLFGGILAKALGGKFKKAWKSLSVLKKQFPNSIEYIMAKGFLQNKGKNYSQAINTYLTGLEKFPEHPELLRGLLQSYQQLRAYSRVEALIAKYPKVFSSSLAEETAGDLLANRIRFGETERFSYATEDQFRIETIQALEQRIQDTGNKKSREKFDLLVAYVKASFPQKAVDLYQQLLDSGKRVPDYAVASIAKAYLDLRQPQKTIALYQQIYPKDMPFEAQQILFYAYVESRQFQRAENLVAEMRKKNPTFIGKKTLREPEKNQKRIEIELHAISLQIEKGDLKSAYQAADELLREAPANTQIRQQKAIASGVRGWHEAAAIDHQIAASLDVNNLNALINSIDNDMALGNYGTARNKIALAIKKRPNSLRVQRLKKDFERHSGWQLSSNISHSNNKESVFARNEIKTQTTLKAPKINDKFRPYLSYEGNFAGTENKINSQRSIAGIEFESGKNTVQLALGAGNNNTLAADAFYARRLNDYWRMHLGYQKNVTVPIIAVRDGVEGNKISTGLSYRADESFNTQLSGQLTNFNDGNRRVELALTGEKQLHTTPAYTMTAGFRFDYTKNRPIASANYFNPESSAGLIFTLNNRWLLYADYDFRFFQNLTLTAGVTQQKNFERDALVGIQYGHDWELNKDFSLYYYVDWKSQAYDGRRENNTQYMLGFTWYLH